MKNEDYTFNTHWSYSIEEEIGRLTNINVNETTKILGNFMLIALFFITCILWVVVGVVIVFILMFFVWTILSLLNWFFTGNFMYSGNMDVLWNIFPFIVFCCIIYGQYLYIRLLNKLNILSWLREGVLLLYKKLTNTTGIIENIEELSLLIQDILKQTQTIRRLLFFRFFFTKSGKEKLQRLWILATHIAMRALQDIRSDLQIRLNEQIKTLEQAKWEVKKNIGGTSELEQVAELQRSRLDKQVEQFEQLQKTLERL